VTGFMPWQVITYGFLHGGLMHIGFNMLALYMFGGQLEMVFGQRRFLVYYLGCIFAAALTQLTVLSLVGGEAYPTVGASGGVFGLLLAYGLLFPHHKVMLLFPPIPMTGVAVCHAVRSSGNLSRCHRHPVRRRTFRTPWRNARRLAADPPVAPPPTRRLLITRSQAQQRCSSARIQS